MNTEELKKLILDLICTSRVESGFVFGRPSYEEAATIYTELNDDIEDLKYQYFSEYDGYGKEQIKQLESDRKRLNRIVENNLKELDEYKPEVADQIHNEIEISKISSEKLQKFCISFNRSTTRSNHDTVRYINCGKDTVAPLRILLNKLGKARTKLNAIDTVLEDIELDERYNLRQEFESVPDACRFYEKELKNTVTREALKSQIKKFAVFYENGEEVVWSTINIRINAWVNDEGKKPNKQEIPHK